MLILGKNLVFYDPNSITELTLIRLQEVALWHNWKLSVKTGKENGKEEQQNGSFLWLMLQTILSFIVGTSKYL
jgi:hypothetical protein